MPRPQHLFPGQSYTNPATQHGEDMNGPAVTQSAETILTFPRLARQLVTNDQLPHQAKRESEINNLFAMLPHGHG